MLFHVHIDSMKIAAVIHVLYSVGKRLTPPKCLHFLYFPMVSSEHFSVPVVFVHTNTVTRSLALFVPVHTSPLNAWVLSGSNLPIQACFICIKDVIWIISAQDLLKCPFFPVITQALVNRSIFTFNASVWCAFHRLSHPLEQVQPV